MSAGGEESEENYSGKRKKGQNKAVVMGWTFFPFSWGTLAIHMLYLLFY